MCVCVSCVHAAEADNNSIIKLDFICLVFSPLYLVLCIMDFVHSYKLKWKQLIGKDQARILVLQYGLSTSHIVITTYNSFFSFLIFWGYIKCCYFGHTVWHVCNSQSSWILSSIQLQVLMTRVVVFFCVSSYWPHIRKTEKLNLL